MTDIDQLFQIDASVALVIESQAASLAETIAVEDDALFRLDRELKDRKKSLDQTKEDLATLLLSNGLDSIKLSNGLNPQAKVDRKIFKASGVSDDQLFGWLGEQGLHDIIKRTVHFSTLQAALKSHEEGGHELPEDMFQVVNRKTIRMNGKSKFLASRQADVTRLT